MPKIFKKLDGVINNIFSIGLKNKKTTFTSSENGLSIDKNVDIGSNKITTTSVPTDNNDVVNLLYVSTQINNNKLKIEYDPETEAMTIGISSES